MLALGTAVYKGIECRIIFDYKNGNFEIKVLDEILLINEKELDFLVTTP